jgi:hypothetical protein
LSDERLRTLERLAQQGDVAARGEWVRELQRSGQKPASLDAWEKFLLERLDAVRREVDAHVAGRSSSTCAPITDLAPLREAVRQALLERGELTVGYGYQRLGGVYVTARPGESRPVAIMALAARVDGAVVTRIGFSEAKDPSPGTTWPVLSPWRSAPKPKPLEKKFRAWIEGETHKLTLDEAHVWVELARVPKGSKG